MNLINAEAVIVDELKTLDGLLANHVRDDEGYKVRQEQDRIAKRHKVRAALAEIKEAKAEAERLMAVVAAIGKVAYFDHQRYLWTIDPRLVELMELPGRAEVMKVLDAGNPARKGAEA
jgi:hypothetical protein